MTDPAPRPQADPEAIVNTFDRQIRHYHGADFTSAAAILGWAIVTAARLLRRPT